jgi:hypothetical protein
VVVNGGVGRHYLLDRRSSQLSKPATTRAMALVAKLTAVAFLIAQGAIAAPWYAHSWLCNSHILN